MKYIFWILLLSSAANAQTPGTTLGVSVGAVGGSYYDVPLDHRLNKYGNERLSPKGVAISATLESDDFGNIYIRKLATERGGNQEPLGQWDKNTFLGSQLMFLYESPKIALKQNKKKNLDLFVKGNLTHFGQNDHFMYFKVDGEFTPEFNTLLEDQPHARVARKQTLVAPEVGLCLDLEKTWGDFNLSGFAQGAIAPLAMLDYQTKVTEDKIDTSSLDKLYQKGTTFAVGGEIVIQGIAKYKDKYYLKLHFLQSLHQGLNSDNISATNRITRGELGYLINKNVSVNFNVENNELVLKDANRTSIEVYNNLGLGLKYTIPKKKKAGN